MDRRITRTKKCIRSAFLQLTLEKELEKITIKEIAERADVDITKTVLKRGVPEDTVGSSSVL